MERTASPEPGLHAGSRRAALHGVPTFIGVSVDETPARNYYLDATLAYRRACLNAIEYLRVRLHAASRPTCCSAPRRSRDGSAASSTSRTPAARCLPTAIFDFDIPAEQRRAERRRPGLGGQDQLTYAVGVDVPNYRVRLCDLRTVRRTPSRQRIRPPSNLPILCPASPPAVLRAGLVRTPAPVVPARRRGKERTEPAIVAEKHGRPLRHRHRSRPPVLDHRSLVIASRPAGGAVDPERPLPPSTVSRARQRGGRHAGWSRGRSPRR